MIAFISLFPSGSITGWVYIAAAFILPKN
ncbi:MAG: hypothetical protein FWF50_07075 [Defluviitaleaceae bacterium]|nr:hypothetical protein [Defluviitaleaceae bacterium]